MNKKKCFLPLGETFNLAEKSSSELHTQVSFVCLGRWMTSSNLARNSSQYTYYEMRISSAHLYKPRYWPIYSKASKGRNVTRTAYTLWNGRKHELTFTCPGSKRAHICRTHPDQAKRKYQEVPHCVITDSCNFKQNDLKNFALYSREWKLTALMHFESDDTLAALSFKGKALRAATKKKRRWKRREAT